jgi:blue copper oxidase
MRNIGLTSFIVLAASFMTLPGCGPTNDNTNPGDPDTGNKNIVNKKPSAIILPANEQSITVGDTLSFNGVDSFDPDGNTPLSYQWTFTGAATSIQTSNDATPGNVSFTQAGSVTASLVVTDNLGLASDKTAVIVNIYEPDANRPPNGSISHNNGTGAIGSTGDISITVDDSVVFQGNAVDPEGNPITYAWTIPANVTAPAAPDSQPFTATFPVAGTYVIELTVSDNAGNTDPTPAQVTVTVTEPPVNLPPNGTISHDNGTGATGSSGDINITVGTSVVFQGSAVDPENDSLTYVWEFEGGTPTATTGSGPITVSYTTQGSYIARLTVSDSNGNTDPTPAELTVHVNLPEFKYLPVLNDEDGDPNNNAATYNLTVDANVDVEVVTPTGSWTTPMLRYNSLQLPPVIVAKRGTQMTFNVDNNLAQPTTIHWHGFKVPAEQDGGPDAPIAVSGSRTYSFTLVQPAAPLWFHPHAHGSTATQVYNGLAGAFIVTDDISESLENNNHIPSGAHDIALLLQDRLFAADNGNGERALIYQAGGGGMMNMAGMLGDRVLVNGVELPGLDVETRQYRFSVFNGSNARTYDVALDDNATFTVVGTDGGLLNTPVLTDHIMLAAGERAEIVVDFSNYSVGDNVMLVSRSFSAGGMMGGGGALPNGAAFDIMQFQVSTQVTDNVTLYTSLPDNADINTRLTAENATVTRNFVMSMNMVMGGGMQFLINGKLFDMNRVDEVVASGATEIWNISNTSAMAHPFHAHAIQWQILDRNGVPAAGTDLGWKDTVLVQPNENVRFIGRFDPEVNVGKYMYHCHILEHEEAGMMGIFEVQEPAP